MIPFMCLGLFALSPSLLSEFQPNGNVIEFKMLPQLIEHESFVGEMDFVGSICENHKGGRPDTGLGGIEELETP